MAPIAKKNTSAPQKRNRDPEEDLDDRHPEDTDSENDESSTNNNIKEGTSRKRRVVHQRSTSPPRSTETSYFRSFLSGLKTVPLIYPNLLFVFCFYIVYTQIHHFFLPLQKQLWLSL